MNVSIFIKSYQADFGFLAYALRSISKFVSGVSEVVVAVQEEDVPALGAMGLSKERIQIVPRYTSDGYLDQQIHKLLAHLYSDADYFLYWDSDLLAIRPFSPADLMLDGRPRCLETPFDKLVNADGTPATPWRPIVELALGHPVAKERMRQHPFLTHRNALVGVNDYIETLHRCTLRDYIAAQPYHAFSEFNVLHSYSYHHGERLFTFWDTEEKGVPEPFVRQSWSWGGLTPEVITEYERILA